MKKLFILAALLVLLPIISDAAEVRGDDRKDVAPSPIVEPKERRNTSITYESIQPDAIPNNIGLLGPSRQEIHDFLYPTLNDGKVVIPTN
jgi:hypothetical protein